MTIPAVAYEDLGPALTAQLRPRVERLGYLGEFFQRTAHQPGALHAFERFTQAARATVPLPLAEVVALTVATVLENDYERHQHERLSVRNGRSRAWVKDVERLDPSETTRLEPDEQAVQRYVLAALPRAGHGSTEALEELVDEVGPERAVGVLFVLARYVAHAHIANSLALAPPVPSIFEDGFDGS